MSGCASAKRRGPEAKPWPRQARSPECPPGKRSASPAHYLHHRRTWLGSPLTNQQPYLSHYLWVCGALGTQASLDLPPSAPVSFSVPAASYVPSDSIFLPSAARRVTQGITPTKRPFSTTGRGTGLLAEVTRSTWSGVSGATYARSVFMNGRKSALPSRAA